MIHRYVANAVAPNSVFQKLLDDVVDENGLSHTPRTHQQHGAVNTRSGHERIEEPEIGSASQFEEPTPNRMRRGPPRVLDTKPLEHLLSRNLSHIRSVT
jgi:hypothetical protein